MTDTPTHEEVLAEYACTCEVCLRTAGLCPASASSLVLDVLRLRIENKTLTEERDRLREELAESKKREGIQMATPEEIEAWKAEQMSATIRMMEEYDAND